MMMFSDSWSARPPGTWTSSDRLAVLPESHPPDSGSSSGRAERKTRGRSTLSNENTLSGTVSLDASVLIELLSGTVASRPLQEAIENNRVSAYTTFLALSEAEYILCREFGEETARQKLDSLIQSKTIDIVEDSFLLHDAAGVKCGRAIALGDCHTIALAQKLKGTALFAHLEEDLDREIRRKPFPVAIAFLQSDHKSPEKVNGRRRHR